MMQIELLNSAHDRDGFDCGAEALNGYLRNTAQQHIGKGISRTFVLIDDSEPAVILGYYTTAICTVYRDELPSELVKKYPKHDLPAVRLARLAVARAHQRRGFGGYLVARAMEGAVRIAETSGIIGVFVDAKDAGAARYYQRFDFVPLRDKALILFIPVGTLQKAFGAVRVVTRSAS